MVPTKTENAAWADFKFYDSSGYLDRMDVIFTKGTNLVPVSKNYKGLLGFPSTFRLTASAAEVNTPLRVKGAVVQEIQVSLIPIYQFANSLNLSVQVKRHKPKLGGERELRKGLASKPCGAG